MCKTLWLPLVFIASGCFSAALVSLFGYGGCVGLILLLGIIWLVSELL